MSSRRFAGNCGDFWLLWSKMKAIWYSIFLFCVVLICVVHGDTTIESVLKAKGDFSDIIEGASEAGLTSLYNNPSAKETVFTPNNTGLMNTLSQLDIGVIQALQLLQNHTLLRQLLLYGTVNQSISIASLSSGSHQFPSMLGPNLTLVKNSTGMLREKKRETLYRPSLMCLLMWK